MKPNFNTCSNCGHVWQNRDSFLNDPDITIIGYQAHFENLRAGFFLFNHVCKTTLALEVSLFEDLYDGPIFQDRLTGSDDCPGHCLHHGNLDPCDEKCECAFVREIIQLLKNRPYRRPAEINTPLPVDRNEIACSE